MSVRTRYEFIVELEHVRDAADRSIANTAWFEPMARLYRRVTLMRLVYLVPVLIFAGIGVVSMWDEAEPVAKALGGALGAGVAGLFLAAHASLGPYLRRVQQEHHGIYVQSAALSAVGDWVFEVREEGVEFRSPNLVALYPWRAIESIETPAGLVIQIANIGPAVVPSRAFADESERDALAARLRELRAAHPPPRNEHLGRMLAASKVRCARCLYDLGGCEQPTCPECGYSVAASIAAHFYLPSSLSPFEIALLMGQR